MARWLGAFAVVGALILMTGQAGGADNAAAPAPGDVSSPVQGASFFEGTWRGSWRGFKNPGDAQDVTLRIGKANRQGAFPVHYSWGIPPAGTGFPPPGSLKTKGREDGDRFVIRWTNKSGNEVELVLKRVEDGKVAARLEKSGVTGPNERPYLETYLNRE